MKRHRWPLHYILEWSTAGVALGGLLIVAIALIADRPDFLLSGIRFAGVGLVGFIVAKIANYSHRKEQGPPHPS